MDRFPNKAAPERRRKQQNPLVKSPPPPACPAYAYECTKITALRPTSTTNKRRSVHHIPALLSSPGALLIEMFEY